MPPFFSIPTTNASTNQRFFSTLLATEVRDHLDEEEHGTFQLAGKLLSKTRQQQLAREYRAEYSKRGGPYTT